FFAETPKSAGGLIPPCGDFAAMRFGRESPGIPCPPVTELSLRTFFVLTALVTFYASIDGLCAEDWSRFRGPNGSGVSMDAHIPIEWSDGKNLAWKADLPGPGSSSPIVIGDLVIITSYSGYGVEGRQGRLADLKRHVVAFDAASGDQKWSATVDGTP